MKRLAALTLALLAAVAARADDVQVAVAANFTGPMQVIAALFERDTGHKAVLSFGATGKFYAQIVNGAPFEVFVSADEETPLRLEQQGLARPGTRFTYAYGRLVLWRPQPGPVDAAMLERGEFRHLAVSHPKLTVYGAAAHEVLRKLGLLERLAPRLLQGETITQAYQYVASGNAELGFVALSQVWQDGALREGAVWIVPDSLCPPIRQYAVLLARGAANPAAAALLDFLRSREAQDVMRSHGYSL